MENNKYFKNILIANRGLSALKFIISVQEWMLINNINMNLYGLVTDDDLLSNYKYLELVDEVIYSKNRNIYNSIDEIIEICLENNIVSVWPGWGYLSENPLFSKKLKENNIIFIGPSEYSLNLLGDKVECMKMADKIKIPQLAWSKECTKEIEVLKKHSLKIGLPVILKASDGGGGKGIRILEDINDIEKIIDEIKKESNGSIFVMKLAQDCKHLEVQIVSDGDEVITLSSRDCSTQRRRQKLIEEAPAAYISEETHQIMLDSAKKIVKSVGLVGVCTVEFLLDKGNLSFMEVNPRLQVEHIVTETIFNLNLPSIQIMLASGMKIKNIKELSNLSRKGHAISVRINSENAYNNFKPLTGKIKSINFTSTNNTWAYFSVNNNSEIVGSVDNQFGHIVAWGENREIARKRAILFLNNLKINSEILNTAKFLKEYMNKKIFINQKHNVRYLDMINNSEKSFDKAVLLGLIAKSYYDYKNNIFIKENLIKNGHKNCERYIQSDYDSQILYNKIIYKANISFENNLIKVIHNNKEIIFNYQFCNNVIYLFISNKKLFSININHIDNFGIKINISSSSYNFSYPSNPNEFRTNVSGKVVKLYNNFNNYYEKDTSVLSIEIMKMVVDIKTTKSGKIDIYVEEGDTLEKNQLLFKIIDSENKYEYQEGILNLSDINFKKLSNNKNLNNDLKKKLNKKLSNQEICKKLNTTYIYDLIEYFDYKSKEHIILDKNNNLHFTLETKQTPIIAFKINLKNNNSFILIANDITIDVGSFDWDNDLLFYYASKYARENKLPRIYISCNSGAKLEINENIKKAFKIKFKKDNIFDYIYLDEEDYIKYKDEVVVEKINNHYLIKSIKNNGVKNLNGSALIASETSKCCNEIFTLTYVTGRSVGIGAYLTKLGLRTIQKNDSPILLTGNVALNKVLGKNLYLNNMEIGGSDIMSVNSTSHIIVDDDYLGIKTIEKWLSYLYKVPFTNNQSINYIPENKNYEVNNIMAEFFDKNSIFNLFPNWGNSILGGKARLNGNPVTFLVCNNSITNTNIPIDPGNIESKKTTISNPPCVLNPHASQKIAQLIKESSIENLPLFFLVNLRGFSGGTNDMLDQILTHGSDIVRNLSEYNNKVYIYLLPFSQLRGGAMVVISKLINSEKIEIYADPTAKANILEHTALQSIKYKKKDILNKMENENENYDEYHKAIMHFCELHDNIDASKDQFDGILKWNESRQFFIDKVSFNQNIYI